MHVGFNGKIQGGMAYFTKSMTLLKEKSQQYMYV